MKRFALLLTLLFSLAVKPAMANDYFAIVSSDHSHVSDHDHHGQEGDHAQMDMDSEGNPHDGSGHGHNVQHQHGECYRPCSSFELPFLLSAAMQMSAWDDSFYPDHSPGPLLEPPSRA